MRVRRRRIGAVARVLFLRGRALAPAFGVHHADDAPRRLARRLRREIDRDGTRFRSGSAGQDAHDRTIERPVAIEPVVPARDDLGHFTGGQLNNRTDRHDRQRRREEQQERAIDRVARLFVQSTNRRVRRRRREARLRSDEIVVPAGQPDEPRLQRRCARPGVQRSDPLLPPLPQGFEGDDRAPDGRLVQPTERRQDRRRTAGQAIFLIFRERHHARHRHVAARACLKSRRSERHRARATDVVHHRGHRDLRQGRAIRVQLARDGDRQDRRVDRFSRLVVVRVARLGHAEEGERSAGRQVDQALRDALDAPGQDVPTGLQILEEAAHDDDRRGVHSYDLLLLRKLLDLETTKTRRLADRTEANRVRRQLQRTPFFATRLDAHGLGEDEERIARRFASDDQFRAAAPLHDLGELGRHVVDLA